MPGCASPRLDSESVGYCIALSAASHILGDCEYLRTVNFEGVTANGGLTAAVAIFFSNPAGGERVVTWADDKCDANLPIHAYETNNSIKVSNIFGTVYPVKSDSGAVHLHLGTEPIYVLIPKPKPLFPFDEVFASESEVDGRWSHVDNGGNATVSGSMLNLSGNGTGYPVFETLGNPFPVTADWIASIGYKYTSVGNYGTGVELVQANGDAVASIHQDVNGQYVSLGPHQVWHSQVNTDAHIVSFVYSKLFLRVFVDNTEVGRTGLSSTPCLIRIGGGIMSNPWDWNNLSIRFIQVHAGTQPPQP